MSARRWFAVTTLLLSSTALSQGGWQSGGSMLHARLNFTATGLPSGSVLIAGGQGLKSLELYNPEAKTSVAAGDMAVERHGLTATLLKDGRVLLVGGLNTKLEAINLVEIFDPKDNSLSVAKQLSAARGFHQAVPLGDGRVLVLGGHTHGDGSKADCLASAELYDPAQDQWTTTQPMVSPRCALAAALLLDGSIVVAGGRVAAPQYSSVLKVEAFNPQTLTFSVVANLPAGQSGLTLSPLGGAEALIASNQARLYQNGTLTDVGSPLYPRYGHTATRVSGGKVLLIGGDSQQPAELYDPTTRKFATAAPMSTPRGSHAAIAQNGKAYVFGGWHSDNPSAPGAAIASIEVFSSGEGSPLGGSCTDESSCASGYCVQGLCCAEACSKPPSDCRVPSCSAGACAYVPKATSSACDDGNVCTYSDACDGQGTCAGTAYLCEVGPCDVSSRCDGQGSCLRLTQRDGTQCSNASMCIDSGVCSNGQCQGPTLAGCSPEPIEPPRKQGCGCQEATGLGAWLPLLLAAGSPLWARRRPRLATRERSRASRPPSGPSLPTR